jgi:xanthine dehydrogenase accessory factor
MSELLQVAAALTRAARDRQVSVLATVVRTEGSTYRRIGARMLALADGSQVGAVSAGCIESDVLLRAERVRSGPLVELVSYDTRSSDDLLWGTGTGCGGVTELLLEALGPERASAKASLLSNVAESRTRSVLATVVRASGLPLGAGDQAVLPRAGARLRGFDTAPALVRAAIEATARHRLRVRSSSAVHHTWGEEGEQALEIAYEVRSPRIRLCVCGAGPDAVPLVALAKLTGWQVTLIDHRPAMLASERWPEVECLLLRSPAEVAAAVEQADCDAVVVMSHHYERDLGFLAAWLGSAVPFIGMLGPRQRTERMLATLAARGFALESAERRVHAPVGLDLGADTAEEIALSIVAEIKAITAGRNGRPLRNRLTRIHDRSEGRMAALR